MRKVLFCAPVMALVVSCFISVGCNELAGIHEGLPPGSDVACKTVDDCPPPEHPDCATLSACEGDVCQYTNALDGKPLPVDKQVIGDCSQIVCDGDGQTRLTSFDADAEEDGNPCTQDSCVGGNSVHTPQQQVDCYVLPDGTPGPVGTKGIGNCAVGVQLCDADFQPIGGCEGAVFPIAETCNAPGDEDCDGLKNEEGDACYCTPSATDSCYGGDPVHAGVGICELGQCLCNATGTACDTACLGWKSPEAEDCSTPTDDDCDGDHVDPEDGCVCVANSTENCYFCAADGKGYIHTPLAIDDCEFPGDDDCDGTAVDSCTGSVAWVKSSTQTGSYPSYTTPTGIAVDSAGNVTIVGWAYQYNQVLNFGGGALSNPASSPTNFNVFVVNYSAMGAHRWSKLLPCASTQIQSYAYDRPRVAVAGTNVAVAIRNQGSACDFGSGVAEAYSGAVVVRLNGATGAFVNKGTTGTSGMYPYALVGRSDGSVVVGGWLPSGDKPALVKLDGSGAIAWAKEFTLPAYYYGYESNAVRTVAFLDDGAVAFTGTVQQSTIDLGGGALGASQRRTAISACSRAGARSDGGWRTSRRTPSWRFASSTTICSPLVRARRPSATLPVRPRSSRSPSPTTRLRRPTRSALASSSPAAPI